MKLPPPRLAAHLNLCSLGWSISLDRGAYSWPISLLAPRAPLITHSSDVKPRHQGASRGEPAETLHLPSPAGQLTHLASTSERLRADAHVLRDGRCAAAPEAARQERMSTVQGTMTLVNTRSYSFASLNHPVIHRMKQIYIP